MSLVQTEHIYRYILPSYPLLKVLLAVFSKKLSIQKAKSKVLPRCVLEVLARAQAPGPPERMRILGRVLTIFWQISESYSN